MRLQSLYQPLMEKAETTLYSESLTTLMDAIILKNADLIVDIENGNIDESVLVNEISKAVDKQKGIFNREGSKKVIFDTLFGYGVLEGLLEDDKITDIDVLRHDYIVVTKEGKRIVTDSQFESIAALERFCKLIVLRNGGLINEVDNHCRVSDLKRKMRINATLPPRSLNGPTLNIRKHQYETLSLEKLVDLKMFNSDQLAYLYNLNRKRKNIMIAGKGGAGKTTLLRGIVEDVDKYERMLICESDAEIYPQAKNIMVQTIKKAYLGGRPQTLADLVKDGLTMSLDTYCVGELTGNEAWDFIKAGHTSHRILATIHANSAEDVFNRLLMLIETESRLPEQTLIKMIAESMDVIIYIEGFKIKEIIEVVGYNYQEKAPHLKRGFPC